MRTDGGFREDFYFLSNMFPVTIHHQGLEFGSSENFYQWQKVCPSNRYWQDKIRTASPKMSKVLVRSIDCPKRQEAEDHEEKIRYMTKALILKFDRDELRDALLATDGIDLVEVNWWNDTFWGEYKGKGSNHLGKLLMDLRGYYKMRRWRRIWTRGGCDVVEMGGNMAITDLSKLFKGEEA